MISDGAVCLCMSVCVRVCLWMSVCIEMALHARESDGTNATSEYLSELQRLDASMATRIKSLAERVTKKTFTKRPTASPLTGYKLPWLAASQPTETFGPCTHSPTLENSDIPWLLYTSLIHSSPAL